MTLPASLLDVPVIVKLPPGALACLGCGVAVQHPDPRGVERLTMLGRISATPQPRDRVPQVLTMARCPSCLALFERAVALLDEHPRVEARNGSRFHALDRVECALSALDLLGASASAPIPSDETLGFLVSRLSTAGAMARWSGRFVPFGAEDVGLDTCITHRWAHVPEPVRQLAREGLAAVLRARVEVPVRVPCPPSDDDPAGLLPSGCGFCGVSSVMALPSAISGGVWSERSARPTTLGGRQSPEAIDFYLCPACDRAVDRVGGVGQTAMERALLAHLQAPRRSLSQTTIEGLVAHVVTGLDPVDEPWSFLPDLAQFAHDLRGSA